MPCIRRARPTDSNRLVQVWLESVQATHSFLTDADIQNLLPLVRDTVIPNLVEIWLVCEDDAVAGFMGLRGHSLDALYIAPSHFRRGCGRCLVEHARRLKGPLVVSANEQNSRAIAFYRALGFEIVGRSPVDAEGRPFPLLHLRDMVPRSGQQASLFDAWLAQVGGVLLLDGIECEALDRFLINRIEEFNAEATGCFDARLLGGVVKSASGEVAAGITGYTWGGCCEISSLWVQESHRNRGLGRALLYSAEREAVRRGCTQVVVRTHSFQAPTFYERLGYQRRCAILGLPTGHSDIVLTKRLEDGVQFCCA